MNKNKATDPVSTQELDRLQATIEENKKIMASQQETITKFRNTIALLDQKISDLEKSNETALEKIKGFESAETIMGSGDSAKEGYVTIATLKFAGKFPPATKVDGMVIPRKIDGDVMYESLPVVTALRMLTEQSAFKRSYMGPKDKIEGTIPMWNNQLHGKYLTPVKFNRSKIDKSSKGETYFIEVIVEDPENKVQ